MFTLEIINGEIVTIPTTPMLKPDGVPTKFPNLPIFVSKFNITKAKYNSLEEKLKYILNGNSFNSKNIYVLIEFFKKYLHRLNNSGQQHIN